MCPSTSNPVNEPARQSWEASTLAPPAPWADPSGSLPVVETFHSLQGEGMHAGRSAFFIRLAGCTVGCPWCDTKHSWSISSHPVRSLNELAQAAASAAAAGASFVVITGGEPLHHQLEPLVAALRTATASADRPAGLPIHLETSGVDALSGSFDWIALSPKRHRPPRQQALATCHELKVVVGEKEDLAFAEAMALAAIEAGRPESVSPPILLLQPLWDCPVGQELAIAHVRQHPRWRLSLQSHKWLGVR